MTLEDIYKMAMTPLPPPPDLSPQLLKLIEAIKANTPNMPTIPDFPKPPAWWPQRPPEP